MCRYKLHVDLQVSRPTVNPPPCTDEPPPPDMASLAPLPRPTMGHCRHAHMPHSTDRHARVQTCVGSQVPGTWRHTRPLWGEACPSPSLSGVLGTARTGLTCRKRHSRRIASAANFSSAVQMMIKCYCARENGKEGVISFIVRKDSTGSNSQLRG